MEMTNLIPLEATLEDRQHAWGHAFCYADCQLRDGDTRKPEDYANHYSKVIDGESNIYDWPDHTQVFWIWERETRS